MRDLLARLVPRSDAAGRLVSSGLASIVLGMTLAIVIAASATGGPYWSDGFLLCVYLLAAGGAAGLLGLIFAIPRARTDTSSDEPGRFVSNSNLEQISDWLTKILVGAGLVQLRELPGGLRALGDYLGGDLAWKGAAPASVALTVYGAGVGFLYTYVWSRLRLRVLLEASEKQAEDQARTEAKVTTSLLAAERKQGTGASPVTIAESAARVTAAATRRPAAATMLPVLWVDDRPANNDDERAALAALGIVVRDATSTAEGIDLLQRSTFGAVITDLGRREDGAVDESAGLKLIAEIRKLDASIPIFVYGGVRAFGRRDELIAAGARDVFNRAADLIENVVDAVAKR